MHRLWSQVVIWRTYLAAMAFLFVSFVGFELVQVAVWLLNMSSDLAMLLGILTIVTTGVMVGTATYHIGRFIAKGATFEEEE